MADTAAIAIGTSHRHATVEIDGVTRGVPGFFTTVGDVLHSTGVTVGDYGLVAPTSNQTAASGNTVAVCTVTECDATIGDNRITAWFIALSISGVLSALPASVMSIVADRSYTYAGMPIAEAGQTVHAVADGTTMDIVVSPDGGMVAILEKAGVSAGPIDRVILKYNGGEVILRVARVVCGTTSSTTETPHKIEERENAEAEEGTEKTVQGGAAGSEMTGAYQETIDDDATASAVLSTTRIKPAERIISRGTKAKRAEDMLSSLSTSSDSSGASSSGLSASASAAVFGDGTVVWATITQCESGDNPSISTGNDYYDIYQFSPPTWRPMGGSGLPSDASVEEQTMHARMPQQRSGWGQWGCAYKLGLI